MTSVILLEVRRWPWQWQSRVSLPQDKLPTTPNLPVWHSLPAYVKDSGSGPESCLEFIQEIAEIHRLMGEEQWEKEKSLPQEESLTCSWSEQKAFSLGWVVRSCPLVVLLMLVQHIISHSMPVDVAGVGMQGHSINVTCHSQRMTKILTPSEHLPWRQWNSCLLLMVGRLVFSLGLSFMRGLEQARFKF